MSEVQQSLGLLTSVKSLVAVWAPVGRLTVLSK